MRHIRGFLFVALLVLAFGGGTAYGTTEDLTKEGSSGTSYGRVKCSECGFDFKASDKGSVEDLTEDKASGISYGRVKCTRCGFDFSVKN